MNHRITIVPFLFIAMTVFLLCSGPVRTAATPANTGAAPFARITGGDDDSLRTLSDFMKEHKRLREALDALRKQMDDFSAKIENLPPDTTGEINNELTRMDEDIRRAEEKLNALGEQLRERLKEPPTAPDAAPGPDVVRFSADTTIAAGSVVKANVVASNCTLTVAGKVDGDILVIDGGLVLKAASEVTGDVVGIHSSVTREDGSVVDGTVREEAAGFGEGGFFGGGDNDSSWTLRLDDENGDENHGSFFRRFTESQHAEFPLGTTMSESFVRFNRVEGLYLGISDPKSLGWHSKRKIDATFSVGYGFAAHRWRYSGGLYVPFYLDRQIIEFGLEGHSFTDSKDQWIIDRDENSVMSFFAKEDFMDYFQREGFSATVSWYSHQTEDWNLKASLGYLHDTYRSLDKNTNWSLFGGDKVVRENPLINDGNLNSFVLMLGASNAPATSSARHGWDIRATFENAGGAAKGDFDFRQAIIDVRRYQPLVRFLDFNVRLRGGASSGTVPLERAFDLGGVSTLPGYRYKEFSGTHFALVNLELIIKSSVAEYSTGWLSSLMSNINLILFADAGVTNNEPAFTTFDHLAAQRGTATTSFSDGLSDLKQWKSDVGFAIGSAGGGFRIGAAWRTDQPSKAMLVVRFSRPF